MVEGCVSREFKNNILRVLNRYTNPSEILELPNDFRTLVGPYPDFSSRNIDADSGNDSEPNEDDPASQNESRKEPKKKQKPISQYIYFGIQEAMQCGLAVFDPENSHLELDINADGLKLYKTGEITFWPILGRFSEDLPVFVIAIYYGSGKPKNSHKFLDFLQEFEEFELNDGAVIDNKGYTISFRWGIFDTSARCFILGIPYYNSTEGCYLCEVEGAKLDFRMTFLQTDAKLRTANDSFYLRSGNVFSKIKNFDPTQNIPPDPMHLAEMGVMKKLLCFWYVIGFVFNLLPNVKAKLSEMYDTFCEYTPREFNRRPRPLKHLKHFTSKEYRMILLYTGPVIFKDVLPSNQYLHFLSFHVAYRILNDDNAIQDDESLDYAEELLIRFVQDFPDVYSEQYCSFNVHAVIHLVSFVRRWRKTLFKLSAYPFETFLRKLKLGRLVKSAKEPIIQVARRIYEMSVLVLRRLRQKKAAEKKKKVGLHLKIPTNEPNLQKFKAFRMNTLSFNVSTKANRFCEVDGSRIFMIQYFVLNKLEEEAFACGVFLDGDFLEPLYTVPCSSQLVGVHKYSGSLSPVSDERLQLVNIKRISGKFFHVPISPISLNPLPIPSDARFHAFIRLLHDDVSKEPNQIFLFSLFFPSWERNCDAHISW